MPEVFKEKEKIRVMVCQQDSIRFHSHDFLEMVYVINGKALHTLNNQNTIVKKGDYFIIDYGAVHKYTKIDDSPFEIINILFKPEIIDKTLVKCKSFQDLINHYLIKFSYEMLKYSPTNIIYHDKDKTVYHFIEKLQFEFEHKNPGYMELMRCYLIEIIITTMRGISKENSSDLYHDLSKYIIDYIDENYMNPITLTQISERLNFSVPYICKKFKNDVGISFNEYLQKKRIEQSCRLILNTDKKISEIAELVGYNDIKFFHQVFKKYIKMTPREFRKIYCNESNTI